MFVKKEHKSKRHNKVKAAEDILNSSDDELNKMPHEYDTYFNALSNKLSFDQKSFAGSFNSRERKMMMKPMPVK
jgi:hypothetical protein